MDQYNDPHATSSPPEGVVLDTHQIIHHDGENLNNLGDELLNSSDLISPNSDSTVLEQQNRSSAGSTLRDSSTARLGRPSRRRRTDSEMKGTDSDIVKKDPAKGHVGGDNRAPSAMENLLSSNTRKTPWDAAAFEKTSHRRERGSRYSVVVEGFPQGKDTTPIQKPDRVGAKEVLPSTGPPLRSTTVRETEDSTDSSCTGQELIAAIAIGEEDEESQEKALAHAMKYDLESKPRIYQDPRFRRCCTMGTVLFVLSLVMCSVVIVIHKKNNHVTVLETLVPTTAPTSSPTSVRDMEYRNYPAQSVNDKVFNPETPHYTAVEWIVNKDPMQMELTDPKLLQRFLMALLYFQSTDNGSKEWKSCNPPKEGEDDTCVFMTLTHLANNTEIYVPVGNYTRWLSGEDECSWAGLYCDGSQVVAINIDGQNMTGPLPSELVLLPGLQSLSFSNNQITGSIPIECATFRNLLNLELNGNHLTGTIPTEFFEQGSLPLENFNLGDNDLNGTLDTRIGSVMTNLKGLHIFGNHFHGQFPSEAGNLRYLSFFPRIRK